MVHEKECFAFWRVLCTFLGSIIFPGMLVLFIGYELHFDYYKFALPYSLAGAFVVLAITTAAYFLYDPYRAARRRISDAKSMIKTVEKSARKQVKKNQKMLAKQDVKQQRLLKKQEVKAQSWFKKLRQKIKKPKQAEDDAIVEEKEQAESQQLEVQSDANVEGSSTEPEKDTVDNETETTEAEADNSEEEKSETVEDTASEDN